MEPWNGYYTPEQAARVKQVSRASVYSAIHGGRLVADTVGGRRMITVEALAAWHPVKDRVERGRLGGSPAHRPRPPGEEGAEGR